MKKINIRGLKDYLGITFGAIFFGVAYAWFLIPFKVSPGGVGGISQILFHLTGIPAGISMVLMNIPLFIIALLIFGKRFGIRSFYGMFVSSIFVDLFSPKFLYNNTHYIKNLIHTDIWAFTDNIFLACSLSRR